VRSAAAAPRQLPPGTAAGLDRRRRPETRQACRLPARRPARWRLDQAALRADDTNGRQAPAADGRREAARWSPRDADAARSLLSLIDVSPAARAARRARQAAR